MHINFVKIVMMRLSLFQCHCLFVMTKCSYEIEYKTFVNVIWQWIGKHNEPFSVPCMQFYIALVGTPLLFSCCGSRYLHSVSFTDIPMSLWYHCSAYWPYKAGCVSWSDLTCIHALAWFAWLTTCMGIPICQNFRVGWTCCCLGWDEPVVVLGWDR